MAPHILDFREPETSLEVAPYLALTDEALQEAIAAGRAPDEFPAVYIRHQIPKRRGGGHRTVWDIADAQLRDAHRAFAWRFEDFARDILPEFPHSCAFGYVRGRSIKDNAARHLAKPRLMRCDLKDFFSTIGRNRLAGRFSELGIRPVVAGILADFATIEGKLALGLNGSPMLANLVCYDLDQHLQKLAADFSCTYTRYADDISISGENLPDRGHVVEIVEGQGFCLSAGKMRITKLGQAHFVTGLSVSDRALPRVPRGFKRRLRQELYYCDRFGIRGHLAKADADKSYQKGINRIDGSVRFISAIEPVLGSRMLESWRTTMIKESAVVSYAPVHDRVGTEVTFFVDETCFLKDGKKYLALGCVTTQQAQMIREHANACLRQYLIDPYAPGRKSSVRKKGLHFTDAHETLRAEYATLLPYLQFRAYVAFGELLDDSAYRLVYSRLLRALLPRRFRGSDRCRVTVLAEENPTVPEAEVSRLVTSIYADLQKQNERRPVILPSCQVLSKEDEPGFSLADCLLWTFARTFAAEDRADVDYLRFERIRDKYRHIINIDTGEIFSRRHPIELSRPKRQK